jgi:Amt family ammonium transporter
VVKRKFGYDDSLDAFGCHGIGGIWGAIATGLFCNPSINSFAKNYGLFLGGGFKQVWIQVISVGATIVLSGVVTYIALKIVSIFTDLRVSSKDEIQGLDIAEHGETAYLDFVA